MSKSTKDILAYRVFLFLKDLDSGSGWIEKPAIKKLVPEFFGKEITYNYLSRMEELNPYLEVYDHAIRLKSWKKIWEHYNIAPSSWVYIPKEYLAKKSDFIACIYVAWLDGKTISREKIEGLTSIPKSTQISYEKRLGVQTRTNYQVMSEEEYLDSQDIPVKDGKVVGVYYKDGKLYRQLPNSYYSKTTKENHNKKRYLNFLRQLNGHKDNGRTRNCGPLFVDDRFIVNGKITVNRTHGTSFFELESNSRTTYWHKNPYGYTFA